MNDNGKFRKRNGYTTTGNTLTRDTSVSLKAKGLYLVIMSYITLPNLELTKEFIFKQCREGKKGFESSWNELKDRGYLKVYFFPGKNGFQSEYELLDEPSDGPHTFYLDANGHIKSTNIDRKNKKETENSEMDSEPTAIDAAGSSTPALNRCPQKVGNAAFDRYPQKGNNAYGNNAYGGNNINTNNKPLNNFNNLSIYQNEQIDGMIDVNLEEISNNERLIPYTYAFDYQKMSHKIKDLVNYKNYSKNSDYSKIEQQTHNLIVDCLIEMATEKNIKTYGGCTVSYANVIDKINECCVNGEPEPLHLFVDMTMENYVEAAKTTEIKNIKSYIKSCIWNSFSTYKVKWESFFERTYRAALSAE